MPFVLRTIKSWKLAIILVFFFIFQILTGYFWIDINSIIDQKEDNQPLYISGNEICVPRGMYIQSKQSHGGSDSLNAVFMISTEDYIIVSDLKSWDDNKIDVHVDNIRAFLAQQNDQENNYFYLFNIEADVGWGYHYMKDSNSDIAFENIYFPSRNLYFSIIGNGVDFDTAVEYLKEIIYVESDTLTWDRDII